MTTLAVGASGATGRLLVEQLLKRGQKIRSIVRTPDKLAEFFRNDDDLSVIRASVPDLGDVEMTHHVNGCKAVASCLGHNLSVKGSYGKPRRLVTETVRRLCGASKETRPEQPVKLVLMNTTGNSNRDLYEPVSFAGKCVIWLLRLLLPPHVDNEEAADYLRTRSGQNDEMIAWVAVRPDTLIDAGEVTGYDVHCSPLGSAIFDAGTTSRINVGHFVTDLITGHGTWSKWKGQMPVIYNKAQA